MSRLRQDWQTFKQTLKNKPEWAPVANSRVDLGDKLDNIDSAQNEVIEQSRDIGRAMLKLEPAIEALIRTRNAYLGQLPNLDWSEVADAQRGGIERIDRRASVQDLRDGMTASINILSDMIADWPAFIARLDSTKLSV